MSSRVKRHGEIINETTRILISMRYQRVSKAINREFRDGDSGIANSLYVGSYGRGTAINTSDIDIMAILPESEYKRYDTYRHNGQSRLLQSVRQSIQSTYANSEIHADGQIVKISFSDGMKFEILPAFESYDYWGVSDGTYTYPDSNMGGNWCSTNPKVEQDVMRQKNNTTRGLFFDTCKHIRMIRDTYFQSYHLSGIVIDSFVYLAMKNWSWAEPGSVSESAPGEYEKVLLAEWQAKFQYAAGSLLAPGSNDIVSAERSSECLGKVLNFMAKE